MALPRRLALVTLPFAAGLFLYPSIAGSKEAPEQIVDIPTDEMPAPVAQVVECMEGNIPKQTSTQRVRITRVDRAGQKAEQQARIEAKRMDEGERRVKICVTLPLDVRGSQVLAVEQPTGDAPEVFVYSPELRRTRRIVTAKMSTNLLGTDVSYEDFTRWQQVDRPQAVYRLADATVSDRAVYVLESRPDPESGSSYERVVSFVDKETCVGLKVESYGEGDKLKSVMVADPSSVTRQGDSWVPMQVEWEDVVEETHTEMQVQSVEFDRSIDDREFWPGDLGRYCR